eukprot:4462891-Pyramimonas_sp.AAC.1
MPCLCSKTSSGGLSSSGTLRASAHPNHSLVALSAWDLATHKAQRVFAEANRVQPDRRPNA